jgi:WhiB family transcriptional regulator, redox-sensing transcriptional regulator
MRKTTDKDAVRRLLALAGPVLAEAGPGEWADHGRCAETDPDIFFPGKGDSGEEARAICARCEVRVQCLAYATRADEFGIWGGLSRAERTRLRNASIARQPPAGVPDDSGRMPAGAAQESQPGSGTVPFPAGRFLGRPPLRARRSAS